MADRKKLLTSVVALGTAAVLALGGTFAWQGLNQTALNEGSDIVNPGGRLHDDFDGTNKDVYVENFTDPDQGGEDIYARIRLEEYFEIIMNKGVEGAETSNVLLGSKDTVDGETTYTYELYKFEDTNKNDDGSFKAAVTADGNSYWNWAVGGSDEVYYMPTFNKNKDSLAADTNGNYVDAVGGISSRDGTQYENYVQYAAGESKTATEIYDGDTNTLDEVGTDFENLANYAENIVTVEGVTHEAKLLEETTALVSMADWLAGDRAAGNYWVYDTDGWVYWANPIKAGETTGRLLDGIALAGVMDDTWYYAINVVAQFITGDDAGKADNTGFYDTAAGAAPTADAEILLTTIGVELGEGEGDPGEDEDPWAPGALLFSLTQRDAVDAFPYSFYDVSDTEGFSFLYDLPIDQANVFDVAVGSGVTLDVSFENTVAGTSYSDNVLTLAAGDASTITAKATYGGTDYTFNILPVYSDIIITKDDTAETKVYKLPNGAYKLAIAGFDEGETVTYSVSDDAMRSSVTEIKGEKYLEMGGYESAESYTVTATGSNGSTGTVKIMPQETHPFDGAIFWLYRDYGEYGLHGIGQLIDNQTYYWSAGTKYEVSVDLPQKPAANFTWTLTDAEGAPVTADKIKFDDSDPKDLTFECGADLTAADTFTLKGVSDVALPTGYEGETGTEYVFYLNFGEKPEGGEEIEAVHTLTLGPAESNAGKAFVAAQSDEGIKLMCEGDVAADATFALQCYDNGSITGKPLDVDTDYTYSEGTVAFQTGGSLSDGAVILVTSDGNTGYVVFEDDGTLTLTHQQDKAIDGTVVTLNIPVSVETDKVSGSVDGPFMLNGVQSNRNFSGDSLSVTGADLAGCAATAIWTDMPSDKYIGMVFVQQDTSNLPVDIAVKDSSDNELDTYENNGGAADDDKVNKAYYITNNTTATYSLALPETKTVQSVNVIAIKTDSNIDIGFSAGMELENYTEYINFSEDYTTFTFAQEGIAEKKCAYWLQFTFTDGKTGNAYIMVDA